MPDLSEIRNPGVMRESQDVNTRAVVKFLLWLSVAVAISFALVYGLLKGLQRIAPGPTAPVSRIPRPAEERLPPPPNFSAGRGRIFTPEYFTNDPIIQSEMSKTDLNFELDDPALEWEIYRRIKQRELESYGVNARTGEIRIPIDVAKRLALERNLFASAPAPQGEPAPTAEGQIVIATSASSGRHLEVLKR
jgi:hypothetical protein